MEITEKTIGMGVLPVMVLLTIVLGAFTHGAWLAPLIIAIGCVLYCMGYDEVAEPFTESKPLSDVREQYINGEIDHQEFEHTIKKELERD